MSEVDALRAQLKNAMQARAMVYAAVYDELEAELGAAKAEAIMRRAIHKRGLAIGAQFARFGRATSRACGRRSSPSFRTAGACSRRR